VAPIRVDDAHSGRGHSPAPTTAVRGGLRAIDAGIEASASFSTSTTRVTGRKSASNWSVWSGAGGDSRQGRARGSRPAKKPREILRRQLEVAIAAEEFEQAARLRDQIRKLSGETRKQDEE